MNNTITKKEIESLCEKHGIKKYTINDDMSIDVDGDVVLTIYWWGALPLNFNIVNGNFICHNSNLTSLKGAPKEVMGNFDISRCSLTSLKYGPVVVGGDFNCMWNKIMSLKSAPKVVGGNYNCSYNNLKTLDGTPNEINGEFNCRRNLLTSLEGLPSKVKRKVNIDYNWDIKIDALKEIVDQPVFKKINKWASGRFSDYAEVQRMYTIHQIINS